MLDWIETEVKLVGGIRLVVRDSVGVRVVLADDLLVGPTCGESFRVGPTGVAEAIREVLMDEDHVTRWLRSRLA
jgi:hypothetical protein